MNKVLTLNEHNFIFDILDGLTPDEVGSMEFENFVLMYEGFNDNCQEDARNRCLLPPDDPRWLRHIDDVYTEVLKEWVNQRPGKIVGGGMAGTDEYPMVWAAFRK